MTRSQELAARHSQAMYQPSLFRATREEVTARTLVSVDEMENWHRKGWLSFDSAEVHRYDPKEETEVWFIKGLARSGLSDAMIDRILSSLEKPYCYEPLETFYSFCEGGWIGLPSQLSPERAAEESIEKLIESEDWSALHQLSAKISNTLAKIDSGQEES